MFGSLLAYNAVRPVQDSCSSMPVRVPTGPRGLQRNCHGLARVTAPRYRHHLTADKHQRIEIQRLFRLRGLLHNHPSGDPTPSHADIDMTKTIVDIARPLGISVHDHIIIGKKGYASMKSLRLI